MDEVLFDFGITDKEAFFWPGDVLEDDAPASRPAIENELESDAKFMPVYELFELSRRGAKGEPEGAGNVKALLDVEPFSDSEDDGVDNESIEDLLEDSSRLHNPWESQLSQLQLRRDLRDNPMDIKVPNTSLFRLAFN